MDEYKVLLLKYYDLLEYVKHIESDYNYHFGVLEIRRLKTSVSVIKKHENIS